MPRGPRKGLTAADAALWKAAVADVAPLRPEEAQEAAPEPPPAESETAPAATPRERRGPAKPAPGPPSLAPLDRRSRQRLARGAPVDARIDLHGLSQHEAHRRLVSFLAGAQAQGHRLVLVITGKGRARESWPAPDERGVLRRLVPQWLALPELRVLVLGFEPAQRTHGGDGALYVRLRRAGRGR